MIGFILGSPGNSVPRRNAIWISQDAGDTWTGPLYIAAQSQDGGYGDALWNLANNFLVVITYKGTYEEADLIQYDCTISGI